MHDRMTFAALLSAAMGAAGLTRYALAEQVGVGRAVVGKWLAGVPSGDGRTRVLPLPNTLKRILDVFPEDVGTSLRAAYLRERGLAEQEPTDAKA
jgi:transcriptional regulator with XRE-family HTH domain